MATMTEHPLATARTVADLLDALGGIGPNRVRLRPALGAATEADLIAANDLRTGICELVDGVLVEKGMGLAESFLAILLGGLLNAFIVPRDLGIVIGPDGMIQLFPGLVRAPDLSFTAWDRIPGRRLPATPTALFAPDLAVEILSPSNTTGEMARKRREYFSAGVRLVWEIDPRARTVSVYESAETATTLDASQTLDGGDVLLGFALPLTELFGRLDRGEEG